MITKLRKKSIIIFNHHLDSPPLVMENEDVESPSTHIKRIDSVENGSE